MKIGSPNLTPRPNNNGKYITPTTASTTPTADFSTTGMVNVQYNTRIDQSPNLSPNYIIQTPTPTTATRNSKKSGRSSKRSSNNIEQIVNSDSFDVDEMVDIDLKDLEKNTSNDESLLNLVPETDLFTLDSSKEIDGSVKHDILSLKSENSTPTPTSQSRNRASMLLQMKPIKSTPVSIKITSPKHKNNNKKQKEKEIEKIPMIAWAKAKSYNDQNTQLTKLPLKAPNNPTHLSVRMVRLKTGTNSYRKKPIPKKKQQTMKGKHRASVTLPHIPSVAGTPHIKFKSPIEPHELHDMKSNLPQNCEIGVFQMTDTKQGTQQKVVLIKYPKQVSNRNPNLNMKPKASNNPSNYTSIQSATDTPSGVEIKTDDSPYSSIIINGGGSNLSNNMNRFIPRTMLGDGALSTIMSDSNVLSSTSSNINNNDSPIRDDSKSPIEESKSPTDSTYQHDRNEFVDVDGHRVELSVQHSITINGTETATASSVHDALQRVDSESTQTKWIKRLMFTIDTVFSPENRLDDGLIIDFEEYYDGVDDDELVEYFNE